MPTGWKTALTHWLPLIPSIQCKRQDDLWGATLSGSNSIKRANISKTPCQAAADWRCRCKELFIKRAGSWRKFRCLNLYLLCHCQFPRLPMLGETDAIPKLTDTLLEKRWERKRVGMVSNITHSLFVYSQMLVISDHRFGDIRWEIVFFQKRLGWWNCI